MKQVKMLFFVGSMALLFTFSGCASEKKEQAQLPPGYKIFCSIEGKYTVYLPKEKRISVNVWDDKETAIMYARHWDEHRNDPHVEESAKYKWSDCK